MLRLPKVEKKEKPAATLINFSRPPPKIKRKDSTKTKRIVTNQATEPAIFSTKYSNSLLRFLKVDAKETSATTTRPVDLSKQIPKITTKLPNLQEPILKWCQEVTSKYANVNITNFTTSFADGLAFCAIIHNYFPEKFDYSKLKAENRKENFDLAFGLAHKLGFEPCLDTEDMLSMGEIPDKKCIFTSIRNFYEFFSRIKAPTKIAPKVDKKETGMTRLVDSLRTPPCPVHNKEPAKTRPGVLHSSGKQPNLQDILLKWCQEVTSKYKNVNVTNFSTSFADGLAFCAILHNFFPEKFDYAKLTAENRKENFDLAFGLAHELGFEPCLDTEDMFAMGEIPDKKCIFTSIRNFYEFFLRIKKIQHYNRK